MAAARMVEKAVEKRLEKQHSVTSQERGPANRKHSVTPAGGVILQSDYAISMRFFSHFVLEKRMDIA
jgi:hypothetical protein